LEATVRITDEEFQARSREILSAATRVFARRGCAQATMQDVAAEAGLSVGAIYRYFPSKDDLVQAVFENIGESTRALFARAVERAETPAEMLRNAGWAIEQRFQEAPAREETILVLEAILAEARREEGCRSGGRQLREAYIFLTERLFRQAQEQGALDPGVDARVLAVLFVSLMVGLHVLSLELGDNLDMAPVPEMVDELLERFAPRTSPSEGSVDDDTLVAIGGSK
jgi:AcrR family transcriptional regulator